MAIGSMDTKDNVVLTGWDAGEIALHQMKDGVTYEQVIAEISVALSVANASLTSGLWGSIAAPTDEPTVEYPTGEIGSMQRHTEYAQPDPIRGEMEGHMLPLIAYDQKLGFTWDYLRNARSTQVSNSIARGIQTAQNTYRTAVLGRLLKRGDDSGRASGLGATGLSAGFATAAANTGVDYTPPSWRGNIFDSDHEHYVAVSGGWSVDVFKDAKQELREHGHEPTYVMLISPTDEDTVRGLTGFYSVESQLVTLGNDTSRARLLGNDDGNGHYIGAIEDFAVYVVSGMPTNYGFGYKSYGQNVSLNPLAVRVPKGESAPRIRLITDPAGSKGVFPLQNAILFFEFGVGVNSRTNGTARKVDNATWSDGTAS